MINIVGVYEFIDTDTVCVVLLTFYLMCQSLLIANVLSFISLRTSPLSIISILQFFLDDPL